MPSRRFSVALMVTIAVVALLVTAPAGFAPSAAQAAPDEPSDTLILNAQQDSWVNQEAPSTNYGGDRDLHVGRVSTRVAAFNRQTLVWFDLSSLPAGAEVRSARLYLYQISASGPERYYIWPDAAFDPWEEMKVTTRVDIEGPGGQVLTTVTAGANPPNVTVVSPNGGETLGGDTIPISWTASDPDGDPLTFNVQYSPDNGASWEMVAQNITQTSIELPTINFVAGANARIRVWASDGIHTASDESDGPFTVPNHVPTVEITQPAGDVTIAISQTLNLEATAYDVDTGTMPDGQVQWSSDRDGPLGNGAQLSVAALSVGTHTITVRADDGQGGVATDSVRVTVLESPLPPTSVYLPLLMR